MKTQIIALLALPLVLSLGACGETTTQRAVTGGAIGTGAGLAIGAIAGWPLLGPAIGGAVLGAAVGAVTTPDANPPEKSR